MNNLSLIAKTIYENKDWKQILEAKNIRIREDEHFFIFNYSDMDSDFSDPIVQEARGIIIDKKILSRKNVTHYNLDVACWPFRKFGNYSESYCDKIDWSSARVQEKIDGSIIKLWFNEYTFKWQWSTNGVIDANKCESPSGVNFMKIIRKASNYKDIVFDKLDKRKTYIFELVSRDNMVVVQYDKTILYHIGTRSNITGVESSDDIGIIKPAEYKLHSLNDCLKAAQVLNQDNKVEHEGFVVVDKNWNRIKIKSPEYLAFHHFANGVFSKSKVIELMLSDDFDRESLEKKFPVWKDAFEFYAKEIKRIETEADTAVKKARSLYIELNKDRKLLAQKIKNDPYSYIMFKSINNDEKPEKLLKQMGFSKYLDLIKDFQTG